MSRDNHLLRVLGLVFGLAAVVGGVIGQGILRAPGVVAQADSSAMLLLGLWLLGGVLSLVLALPFAELGAAIPSAGGGMDYVGRAFGPVMRVAAAWLLLVAWVAAQAMVTYVVGEFLVRLGVGGGAVSPALLATGCLALFFVLNALGTRVAGSIQIGFAALKGALLIGLVVVLFAQAPSTAPPLAMPAGAGTLMAYATALMLIIGACNGWAAVVNYGEEITDPGRAIPRALFGGIAAVTVLYLLVNAAMFHVLPPAVLAASDFAAADAARDVFGERGDMIFTAFGVISVGAISNMILMTTTRIAFATARAGILPRRLAWVGTRGVPLPAMALVALCSAGFILSGTYLALASTSTAMQQGIYILVTLSAIALRRKEPALPRPFRIPAFPLAIGVVMAINLILMSVFVMQDPWNSLIGFAIVAGLTLVSVMLPHGPWTAGLDPESP
jgi:APA family basic amino acid/polyamine antiporter